MNSIGNGKNIKLNNLALEIALDFVKFLVVIICVFSYIRMNYRYNLTASIPTGIYKIYKVEELKRGDVVVFKIPKNEEKFMRERGYITPKIKALIKKIGAVSGDTVNITDNLLYINNEFVKEIPKKDSLDRPMKIANIKNYKLKEDEFFIIGDSIKSYDSSYLGIIKKNEITHKAKLIFETGKNEYDIKKIEL